MGDERRKKLRFDKTINVGDLLQIIGILCGGIWFLAVASTKLDQLGGEMDDLHRKVERVRTDVVVLKAQWHEKFAGALP